MTDVRLECDEHGKVVLPAQRVTVIEHPVLDEARCVAVCPWGCDLDGSLTPGESAELLGAGASLAVPETFA